MASLKNMFHEMVHEHDKVVARRVLLRKTGGQVKTRSTYAWRMQEERAQPLVRTILAPLTGEAPYCEVGQSAHVDVRPVFAVKLKEEYTIYKKRPKGKKLYPVAVGFLKCCWGNDDNGKWCNKPICANCYVRDLTKCKGFEFYVKLTDPGQVVKISDPVGHPKGRRNPNVKDFTPEERQMYSLTTSQQSYRGGKYK